MKGMQNEIIIYQKAFVIHFYGLRHNKGKLSILSEYIAFSIRFNVGSFGDTTNIQTLFDLVRRCLKHVWCYHSHSVPYAGFQVLKIVGLNLVDNVLHITPQEKSNGVKSGDLGGRAFGPHLPIRLSAISLSR
jgi:hypothetical protein